jgi:copper(I)-binding protein
MRLGSVMPSHRQILLCAMMVLAGATGLAQAQTAEFQKGSITVVAPTAAPTAPGQPHGAIFIQSIRNTGAQTDQLIGARAEVSKSMEVHRMTMDNNVMKMREIPGIEVPAKGEVSLAKGSKNGYHLMLMNLKQPLKQGDQFPVTLIFKQAGEQQITVTVAPPKAASGHGTHRH